MTLVWESESYRLILALSENVSFEYLNDPPFATSALNSLSVKWDSSFSFDLLRLSLSAELSFNRTFLSFSSLLSFFLVLISCSTMLDSSASCLSLSTVGSFFSFLLSSFISAVIVASLWSRILFFDEMFFSVLAPSPPPLPDSVRPFASELTESVSDSLEEPSNIPPKGIPRGSWSWYGRFDVFPVCETS